MKMKKTNSILMLTAVFVVILATACGAPAVPATQAAPVEQPAQEQPVVPADTQSAPAEPSAAPVEPSGGELVFPDTVAAETYCVTKIPYQNLFLDSSITFEPQDPSGELKCTDSGTQVDGKNVITCTGKELWTYELKLTDTSNSSSTVIKVNMGACPEPQ
jgi:hypothetical protein